MIRIAIVEDDTQHRVRLEQYLRRYEQENNLRFQITSFQDGIDVLDDYVGQYHLIFLDIQMKMIDGLATARKIREKDSDTILIFVTSLAQHAADGYDVDAKGYLIKPVSYLTLSRNMDKVCRELERTRSKYLLLDNSREMRRINMDSIYYIENSGHYVNIYTEAGLVSAHIPLKDVEERLDAQQFFRCNSGIIVNLGYVETISQHDALIAGKRLAISRNRKKPLMDALASYIGGGGRC